VAGAIPLSDVQEQVSVEPSPVKHDGRLSHPKKIARVSWLRLPAAQALIAQCLAMVLVLTMSVAFSIFSEYRLSILAWCLIQGLCATAFSRLWKLDSWWSFIQLCFPLALLLAWEWHLPSAIYFTGFLICLALYWTTFRTRVPFYPSGPAVWRAVERMLPAGPIRFVDIGSGFGGMVLYLAKQRHEGIFVGIELAPLPWLASRVRAAIGNSRGKMLRGDYTEVNLRDFDVVFAYLSPAAMPALWEQAQAEMKPGSLLLSFEFDVPGVQSQITNITPPEGPNLYAWTM